MNFVVGRGPELREMGGGAIAAAIDDAIGIPGAITQLPVTPQRLKAILDRKR